MTTTEDQRISYLPVPTEDTAHEGVKKLWAKAQANMGFVPNVFLALAHRPAQLRLFMDYHDELMNADEPLTKAEREMIVVATSAERDCLYCVVAHGAILRIRARDPLIADQVAINWRKAPRGARHKAMLEYAELVALDPAAAALAPLCAELDVPAAPSVTMASGTSSASARTARTSPRRSSGPSTWNSLPCLASKPMYAVRYVAKS